LGDSYPGKIKTSIGGVGLNVFLASNHYLNKTANKKIKLISQVSDDPSGNLILSELKSQGIDTSGIFQNETKDKTASYVSIHDPNGALVVACADMNLIENMSIEHISTQIIKSDPSYILFDGNLSKLAMKQIIGDSLEINAKLIFEPTSLPKAARLSNVIKKDFVYPNNRIGLALPTMEELRSMYDSFSNKELFETSWSNVIFSLGLDGLIFKEKLDKLCRENVFLKKCQKNGVFQQVFFLLPYIPSIIVKCGKNGILVFNISEDVSFYKQKVIEMSPVFTLTSKNELQSKKFGVVIEYYSTVKNFTKINNVTGAGDSFAGILFKEL
ncbi:uncharacterized protein ASCRUDRAFT_26207, partial [Ascoidea rubescens DSM 1968]